MSTKPSQLLLDWGWLEQCNELRQEQNTTRNLSPSTHFHHMNVKLLKEVKDFVLKHPRNVDMANYEYDTASCGTVACIAGWACILMGEDTGGRAALRLLQISEAQAWGLFYTQYWPYPYKSALSNKTGQRYANVVAARIDHFIHTGE